MRSFKSTLIISIMTAAVALSAPAFSQQPFDGKKFFEELATRGWSAPAGFDGNKFFEEISSRGFSDKKKLDGKAFFDEIASRGFKAPAGFDGKKFFEEQSKSWAMPPMVDMTK